MQKALPTRARAVALQTLENTEVAAAALPA
jgi:hypothetical protein